MKKQKQESESADLYTAFLIEHVEKLTRLLRESAKGSQCLSPLEIDSALNKSSDILADYKLASDRIGEKRYLAIIAGFGMGEEDNYRVLPEKEIKHIPYHGEYVELYELVANSPLSKEQAKKLGLKFREK